MAGKNVRIPKIEKKSVQEDNYAFTPGGEWVRNFVALYYDSGLLEGEIGYIHDVSESDWHVIVELDRHPNHWLAEAWNREEDTEVLIARGEFVKVVNTALKAMATETVPANNR